jgi:hypothetical protein
VGGVQEGVRKWSGWGWEGAAAKRLQAPRHRHVQAQRVQGRVL